MLTMTGGDESGSRTPATMTGSGGESRKLGMESKWKGKNLYLTSLHNTSIWGIKAFEENLDRKNVEGLEVVVPSLDFQSDMQGLPAAMGIVKLKNKVYMVGGQTTAGTGNPRSVLEQLLRREPTQLSDKVYEFDPASSCCFREVPECRLPLPMPWPIVANVMGKVYVLFGGHTSWTHRIPEKPGLGFQVLEFDTGSASYYWRTLPPPPFYDVNSLDFLRYTQKSLLYVLGQRIFIEASNVFYSFDTGEELWEADVHLAEDKLGAITLSRRIASIGPYRKKTEITDIAPGRDLYFLAAGVEFLFGNDAVYAVVVNGDGIMSRVQWLPKTFPPEFYPLNDAKVIELLEEGEAEEDDQVVDGGHLSSTFSAVFFSHSGVLGLTVFRVSLLSPMVVVAPEDGGEPYLSPDDDDKRDAAGREGGGADFLEVETLETRYYAMDFVPDKLLLDAFFL